MGPSDVPSDVLIVGGGIIGLAIALELHQKGTQVTILSRDFTESAGNAAAGMLAPSAEHIPPGPMAELCQRSLDLYPNWVSKLEKLTGKETGYWPCGILAPKVRPLSEPPNPEEIWIEKQALSSYQPGLSESVVGAYLYSEDAQVDNRALMKALREAVQDAGVSIQTNVNVEGFVRSQGSVVGLRTSVGEKQAAHYVLAAGAWSGDVLPIPVCPRKGQMLSVKALSRKAPAERSQPLRRVLYGEGVYIVPRQDGRIIIGATVENVGFEPHNTPAGIADLLNRAIALYPALSNFPIEEYWWGYRPATPDELPILGSSAYRNLTLATGHYRNGVLLTPITAQLIANHICGESDDLLASFSYQRFEHRGLNAAHCKDARCEDARCEDAYHEDAHREDQEIEALPASASISQESTVNLVFSPMQTIDKPREVASAQDILTIAGKTFGSRLMTGTGKFNSLETMRQSFAASGSEIVTVAVRRVQTNAPGHEGLAEAIDWRRIWMLPNTAGCKDAEEAVRVARLGREMAKLLGQEDNNFVKLEVIPDAKYLLPDPIDTLKAAEQLVKEGFAVLPYINADPLLAKRLEEVGCATVMPLGSPIGSGQGIRNAANIEIIIENANVPVVVDAGIGTPSEAAYAMELGADALLINSAIALANDPVAMGRAMGMAAVAGRLAYRAGRIPVKSYAIASSPTTGTISS